MRNNSPGQPRAGAETVIRLVLPNYRSAGEGDPRTVEDRNTVTSSVIVSGARTPMGRLLGNLKNLPATALGGHAIAAALERGGVRPDQVQYVIMGQVLQAGTGQITARQAAVAAGIPMTTPAVTVNKVCLSGLDAIALADQLIRAGEFEIVVAGGMESMTNAPHLLMNQRQGSKFGDVLVRDHTAFDGLMDPWDGVSMGESTERSGRDLGITRAEQDAFAALSHQRAAEAQRNGHFAAEIAPIRAGQRDTDQLIDTDEGVRPDATAESLGKLRPAFDQDGTITAGSASPISDGAAAVVVMSRAKAEELGLSWLAEITRARQRGRAGQLAAVPAGQRHPARAGQGRADRRRPRPDRDERGVRPGGDPLDARAQGRRGASST